MGHPEPEEQDAFGLLARGLQRCLWDMGWTELRPIQAAAIRATHESDDHLVLMAETAGGKTEAAFLPLLSQIAEEPTGSVRIIYVGPLRALINDQFRRVEELCTHLQMPVHRWHGDVGAAERQHLTKQPGGVLLITPESIESLLVNRTQHLGHLFGGLRAIVIDELHAFLDASRGLHLASVLSRLSAYVTPGSRPIRRVGLSATIGDVDAAKRFLDHDHPGRVRVISDPAETKELLMRLHVYRPVDTGAQEATTENEAGRERADPRLDKLRAVATDLVEHCANRSNLVFCNAKGEIEMLADSANEIARAEGLPAAFLVHHGSLSKELREDTEQRMRGDRPYTALCSSTLEMGIDIGSVHMVGQVGPPWGVAPLKQRLGRSGRRDGEPRRLRVYVMEDADPTATDPIDRLPLGLLQTVAVIDLMLRDRWLEPPRLPTMDLSTLTQQIIALISELGAVEAELLFRRLCVAGAFRAVGASDFAELLRQLGRVDVIDQDPQGYLILGLKGEQIRASRDFYAVFDTPIEYRLLHGSRPLGTLPSAVVPAPMAHIVFAAKRWRVVSVDPDRREINVEPARGRKRPLFLGLPGSVHHRIRERMLEILCSPPEFPFADEGIVDQLQKASKAAHDAGTDRRTIVPQGDRACLLVTWSGTVELRTLRAMLAGMDIESVDRDVALQCHASQEQVRDALGSLLSRAPSPLEVGRLALRGAPERKYDHLLTEDLRAMSVAHDGLDLPSTRDLANALLS